MTVESSRFTSNAKISDDCLDRNIEILRQHLFKQMKASLNIGSELIEKEMTGLSILIKPIVKAFYATLVKKDLENGTIKSINGILKMARDMILDGVEEDSEEFQRRLDEKFPAYLKNDQTGRQCKHSHSNFPKLAENLKTSFEWQVRPTMRLLSVNEPNITCYADMCKVAFKTPEVCKEVLMKQISAMDFGLQVIQKDLSILDIPTARDMIFRVLRRGFDRKTADFVNEVDSFFCA